VVPKIRAGKSDDLGAHTVRHFGLRDALRGLGVRAKRMQIKIIL